MRSVRDTFIVENGHLQKSIVKYFSLGAGAAYFSENDAAVRYDIGEVRTMPDYEKKCLQSLAYLIWRYTKRTLFSVRYFDGTETSVRIEVDREKPLEDYSLQMGKTCEEAADIMVCSKMPDDGKKLPENCHMLFAVNEQEGCLAVEAAYHPAVYEEMFARRIGSHFMKILRKISEEPNERHMEVELESESDLLKELDAIYDGKEQAAASVQTSVIQRLQGNLAAHLERTAVCDAHGSVTYRELDRITNRIANYLETRNVNPNDRIAIVGTRSREMIFSMLGVLKCGATYVPVDSALPSARIHYILRDAQVKYAILLEDTALTEDMDIPVLLPGDAENASETYCSRMTDGNHDTYILYTSGTTGAPKGVVIRDAGIVNLSDWFGKTYHLRERRNILHMTNISFDVSVEEIIVSLLNYCTVFVIPQESMLDKKRFRQYINENHIRVAQFVPVTLQELLADTEKIEALEIVICGGEKLDDEVKDQILKKGYALYNHYGPTEFTVDAVTCRCEEQHNHLGYPIAGTQAFILDEDEKLQVFGAVGELCLSGIGIARGYYNQPEMTAQKFVWNRVLNKRIYKTGDLAVMMPDGVLSFIGRDDEQVKINGLRIELQEIEYHLCGFPRISEAVVVAADNIYGSKTLCAYYKADVTVSYEKIRAYLGARLPQYMIPAQFVRVEKWPVNHNGKIDKKALSAQDWKEHGKEYVLPATEAEKKIERIWKKLLGKEKISVEDAFLNAGGDSLRAAILAGILAERYRVQIPLNKILTSTVRSLAREIKEDKNAGKHVAEHTNLVLLKEGTDETKHLFFVHAGNGEAEVFMDLCDSLTGDYFMWGLRADRLEHCAPDNRTLEETARRYVDAIERVQKGGSYHIAGWCIGGSIAFEMVRQLEQKGREVRFFGMINSFAPDREFWGAVEAFSAESERAFVRRLPGGARFLSAHAPFDGVSELWERLIREYREHKPDVREVKAFVYDDMDRAIPGFSSAQISAEEILYYVNVLRTFDNVRALYTPSGKIRTQCHFFRAVQERAANLEKWNEFCEKEIRVYDVDGDNFSVIRYPGVYDIAEKMDKLLTGNGADE